MKRCSNTFRVGFYKCTLTYVQDQSLHAEWEPSMPRYLTGQQLEQYRNGRDALLDEISKDLGGPVAVIET